MGAIAASEAGGAGGCGGIAISCPGGTGGVGGAGAAEVPGFAGVGGNGATAMSGAGAACGAGGVGAVTGVLDVWAKVGVTWKEAAITTAMIIAVAPIAIRASFACILIVLFSCISRIILSSNTLSPKRPIACAGSARSCFRRVLPAIAIRHFA